MKKGKAQANDHQIKVDGQKVDGGGLLQGDVDSIHTDLRLCCKEGGAIDFGQAETVVFCAISAVDKMAKRRFYQATG